MLTCHVRHLSPYPEKCHISFCYLHRRLWGGQDLARGGYRQPEMPPRPPPPGREIYGAEGHYSLATARKGGPMVKDG